jgi:4-carboxymuconolactone decarboxylase
MNDQTKQPSLDDNNRARKPSQMAWPESRDEFANPTRPESSCRILGSTFDVRRRLGEMTMESPDRERGQTFYERLFGRRKAEFDDLLDTFTIDHLFANVWSRDQHLSIVDRSKITVAILAALGRDAELKTHIKGALRQEISHAQLEEILVHVAHYAGWPAGHRALDILREVENADP